MAKRLHKTLLDYLVIAISPAMIIVLIDSLVLFLVEVFYRGGYDGRLEYVLTLFVIGAVLIGRISIEEGRERAVLFAAPWPSPSSWRSAGSSSSKARWRRLASLSTAG